MTQSRNCSVVNSQEEWYCFLAREFPLEHPSEAEQLAAENDKRIRGAKRRDVTTTIQWKLQDHSLDVSKVLKGFVNHPRTYSFRSAVRSVALMCFLHRYTPYAQVWALDRDFTSSSSPQPDTTDISSETTTALAVHVEHTAAEFQRIRDVMADALTFTFERLAKKNGEGYCSSWPLKLRILTNTRRIWEEVCAVSRLPPEMTHLIADCLA